MESKSGSIHSKSLEDGGGQVSRVSKDDEDRPSPVLAPKLKDTKEEASDSSLAKSAAGSGSALKKIKSESVDEKGVDGEVLRSPCPENTWTKGPGLCRRCCISLDMELDGRIGMWIDPKDGFTVVVDGWGLCEDCEYKRSIETDPNWGRSRRISSEERSEGSREYFFDSDFEEVTSASPSKKKQ